MSASPDSTLLHYRLLEKLGEGGMGVVWKATDTTLDREVAVKILPEAFARETDRLARFEREAKTLAALSHPNIAAVYGLHEDRGVRFLAMELARGEELHRIIKRGPLPVDEAVKIGARITRALEAAHEVGVIHRDLKPANIMVDPDGGVKVLDFGLAKTFEAEPASGGGSMSPTLTTPATRAGVIMGTAAYMSPEQARGKPVDKRADIWAFGVVLWEMLTGKAAFQGETVSDTLASVLKESPDLGALPASTPPAVRRLIARCLEKDPKLRLRDIGEARILLEGGMEEDSGAPEHFPSPGSTSRTAPAALTIAAVALAALLAGSLASWLVLGRQAPEARSLRLAIPVPGEWPVGPRLSRPVAISPSGDRVAYVGFSGGVSRIFSRMMGGTEFEPVPGTESCLDPFFSPDGRSLGFLCQPDFSLRTIDFDAPVRPRRLAENVLVGAVWSEDGHVYYTPTPADEESPTSLHRLPAGGGSPEPVTRMEPGSGELHMWPEILPGGEALIYAVVRDFDFGAASLRILDLGSGEDGMLMPEAQLARYMGSGHLVYLQGETLLASRFDADRMKLEGSSRAVLDGVMTNPDSGSAGFAVSRGGILVYVPAPSGKMLTIISEFDLEGGSRPLAPDPADFTAFRLAPGGDRLAVVTQEGPGRSAIWVHDIRRKTVIRLTSLEAGLPGAPRWTPDGDWVYYAHVLESAASQLMRVPADGSGRPEPVHSFGRFAQPQDISPDGRWLLFTELREGSSDLMMMSLEDHETVRPYVATTFNEGSARISPDGRYVAFSDDSMEKSQVFLRGFPEAGEAWRISSEEGDTPAWSTDGRRIFYLKGLDVMAVEMGGEDEPRPGPPRRLFSLKQALQQVGTVEFSIDVRPGGGLVMLQPVGEGALPTRIDVITEWFGRLEELVP